MAWHTSVVGCPVKDTEPKGTLHSAHNLVTTSATHFSLYPCSTLVGLLEPNALLGFAETDLLKSDILGRRHSGSKLMTDGIYVEMHKISVARLLTQTPPN